MTSLSRHGLHAITHSCSVESVRIPVESWPVNSSTVYGCAMTAGADAVPAR